MLFQVDTDPRQTIVHAIYMGCKGESHREEFAHVVDEVLKRKSPVVIACLQRAHPGVAVAAKRLALMAQICSTKHDYSWQHLLVITDQRDRDLFPLEAMQLNLSYQIFDSWQALQQALPQFLNTTPSSS